MISKIEGVVWDKADKYFVVGVGGIGFKIFTTSENIEIAEKGKAISLLTHLVVKEDALDLYGFTQEDELAFFEMLISISGIGPRTALNVLNISSVGALKMAIYSNDISHLTKVSGIGKKVAEKIVLELKDKVGIQGNDGMNLKNEIDAVEALKALGYSQREAREALKDISPDVINTSDRIKLALKVLGK